MSNRKWTFKQLLDKCEDDFKKISVYFDMFSEEEKILKIIGILFHKVYSKNIRNVEGSLKFSDYLAAEPHIDYHLLKVCKNFDVKRERFRFSKIKRSKGGRPKEEMKKFGIFDVEELENRKALYTRPRRLKEKEFKDEVED